MAGSARHDSHQPITLDESLPQAEQYAEELLVRADCSGVLLKRGGISAQIVFAAHLAMNSIIEVDGDNGTGKWRIFMPCTMMEGGKKVSRWLLGDYDEQYVRIGGTWKFKKIDFVVNYNVPSDKSWAESAIVRPS